MSVQAVVARYREDVSWLAELGLPAVVYDKSGADTPPQGLDSHPTGVVVEPLPNVGREAHSYLTHIVRNYPHFPRHTVFLQGRPFDHLAEEGADTATLRTRIDQAVERDTPFTGLAWFRLQCDGLGRPHQMFDESHRGKWTGWGRDIPVASTFEALFAATAPRKYTVRGASGNFVVRADRILTRPLSFYERALGLVLADPDDRDNTGHAFERLWHLIFNGNARWNRE